MDIISKNDGLLSNVEVLEIINSVRAKRPKSDFNIELQNRDVSK